MGADRVDLHGLTKDGARLIIDNFVIPILPEMPDPFYLITGRGAHNPRGHAVLRHAVEVHLTRRRIGFERVPGNSGLLRVHVHR